MRCLLFVVLLLISAPAWAQPAEARANAIVEKVTHQTGYHFNDRWPGGITAVENCSGECEEGRVGYARLSIVRDEKEADSWVVQEIHVYAFDSAESAQAAVERMVDEPFGPYAKHPYRILRPEGRVIVTVEGRFRFQKYLAELTALTRDALGMPPQADTPPVARTFESTALP